MLLQGIKHGCEAGFPHSFMCYHLCPITIFYWALSRNEGFQIESISQVSLIIPSLVVVLDSILYKLLFQ